MKINVILITYNQESYMPQTLGSILMQNSEHEVEVVVADDASSDNTLATIKEIASKNETPITFKFLPQTQNLGYVQNYKRAFAACDGDFVAIMEGDDYWTTNDHLDRHVNFLLAHSEYSMSFNRHVRLWVDQGREEVIPWETEGDNQSISTAELALGNKIGNLSCCVFRGDLVRSLKPELFDMEIADWMLGMVMGQYGAIAFQKEVTSAYRIHDGGQWSKMNEQQQAQTVLNIIDDYDRFLEYKYTKDFALHKKRLNIRIYGDKSLRGRIKRLTPSCIRNIYRKLID